MKRNRTLRSFFAPAITPVTLLPSQENANINIEQTVETIGSNVHNDAPTEMTIDPPIEANVQNPVQETPRPVNEVREIVLDPAEIVSDPGLRKPIEEYDINIRDAVRREYLLRGLCRPIAHVYPKKTQSNRERSFREAWFKKYPWLEYSVSKDAAFCFYCYLFKQPRPNNYGVQGFIDKGVNNWKNATLIFAEHVGKVDSLHNKARKHCEDFRNQRQSVAYVMSTGSAKQEEQYLGRLTVVLAVVRFLLLQALAFRGHDESYASSNKGNYLELIDWLKKRDKEAKSLLDSAPGNNLLTSPSIQKELCEACATLTTKAILNDIGDRKFSVLVDESRDASIKEQMAVVVRYVSCKRLVIERFLGIVHVPDTTSVALKRALDAMLNDHALSIHNIRGQGYDGASNMRGEFHGLQRLVLDENPYAFYIHCFAHQLQLVVVSVAKCCASVTDFFNYTTLIVNTVNASCKRHDQLAQEHHDNLVRGLENDEIFSGRGKNQETNLARPGDTRWGSHHKTLCRLQLMWQAVLEVLENICDDGPTSSTKTCAAGLIKQMESFEFVFIMHLMVKLLGKTNDLSQCLQRKDQNIVRAVSLIGVTLQKVNDFREHGWEDLFEETKTFCLKHNIIVPNMLDTIVVRGRSRGRGGQLVTYQDHFHHEIYNVVLNQLIVELNNRFGDRSTELLKCIACLDPRNSFANFNIDKLVDLAEIYAADFLPYDLICLREQLETFIREVRGDPEWSSCNDLGRLAQLIVISGKHDDLDLVYRLIELVLILPVATASVERAFSAMNIIKTELRNKMADDWLNHRMMCYIERDIFATIEDEKILRHFQDMRTRRINLPRSSVASNSALGTINEE